MHRSLVTVIWGCHLVRVTSMLSAVMMKNRQSGTWALWQRRYMLDNKMLFQVIPNQCQMLKNMKCEKIYKNMKCKNI